MLMLNPVLVSDMFELTTSANSTRAFAIGEGVGGTEGEIGGFWGTESGVMVDSGEEAEEGRERKVRGGGLGVVGLGDPSSMGVLKQSRKSRDLMDRDVVYIWR